MILSSSKTRNNQKKHQRKIVKQSRKTNRSKKKNYNKGNTQEKKERRIRRRLHKEKKRIEEISQKMSNCFVDQLAKKTGFITRQGKITALAFLVTMAYGLFGGGDKSLILLASNMKNWFGITITAQALSKRLMQNKTKLFLKHALIKVLSFQLSFKNKYGDLFKCFSAIKIEDSTSFELHESLKKDFKGTGGAGSKAGMKLNMCLDLMTNTVTNVDISEGTKSDQQFANNIEKTMKRGELLIRDLGYFNLKAMQKMINVGIFFISRFQKGVNVFFQNGIVPIDLNTFLGNVIDQNMYIGESKVLVRFIAVKVPEEVAKQRIQRYKSVRKKEPTQDYVTWCGYSIFVTNIPKELFSSDIIMLIYKVRWQIELFFKILKQTLKIHIIKTENKNSTYCMIYAKLISLFMASLVVSYAESICDGREELSMDKAMKWLHNDNRFGIAVAKNKLEELLEALLIEFTMICKDNRKKEKSTYQTLNEKIKDNRKKEKRTYFYEKIKNFKAA
jgi:Transposase DDE domain